MIEKVMQEANMPQKTLTSTGWSMKTLMERIILFQLFEKLMVPIDLVESEEHRTKPDHVIIN